jgi:small subunit ribosomal protein S16
MLKIRLSRIGKKNKPMYRLTISENARDPYGKALEILGSYNPYTKELDVKKDRIEHWIQKGAQLTPTTNNLLIENKVIKGDKQSSSKISKKRQAKLDEKNGKKEEETKAEEVKPADVPDSGEAKEDVSAATESSSEAKEEKSGEEVKKEKEEK